MGIREVNKCGTEKIGGPQELTGNEIIRLAIEVDYIKSRIEAQ